MFPIHHNTFKIRRSDFGEDFLWGVTISAYQNEGATDADGKGETIWDRFSMRKGAIKTGEHAREACNFYNKYPEDIALARAIQFGAFGFSVAWSRILPEGRGKINPKGIDFYNRVIDTILENGLQPWLTLYHWDLPQALQDVGGWSNRDIIGWFSDYVEIVTKAYGDRVKNYKVLNEPSAFCGFGYMTGEHAPGVKNIFRFLAASHHANMCQAEGGRIVRENVPDAHVGTSFATFCVQPKDQKPWNVAATQRIDAVINKMYIEPLVGLGYPYKDFPAMHLIDIFIKQGDDKKVQFDFDFIGIQYYCRLIGKFSLLPLIAFAAEEPASKRGVPMNNMGFEIYPEGMYSVLKRYAAYPNVKKLLVTENGVCLDDIPTSDGHVHDTTRIAFYEDYLSELLRAKKEGVPVKGFFCWTLMDNFEWWEGYRARFGLVYVNHQTQQRIWKDSAYWLRQFLSS